MKLYKIGWRWYLGCEINGRLYILGMCGRVGDCISPRAYFTTSR